jgi:predicted metal-binding protein
MTTWITVCDTCKRPEWTEGVDTQTDGERLAVLVEAAANNSPDIKTRRVSCLMGCKHGCNVAVQAHNKLTYTLGDFDPNDDAAAGIVAYATAHAASETGQVPFRTWPQAIKGHFVTRHQPIPEDSA